MKIKKLMPVDAESRRLIDWMEKGVYDALQKKYLRTLLFSIGEAIDGPEYAFSFSYPNAQSQEVCMNFNRTGNKNQGGTFKFNSTDEVTPNQMKSSACKMIRTLVQLMRTLDKMLEEPVDYEPPFFRGCTDEDFHNPWNRTPLRIKVGNVNSKHFVLALKVKSVLDPCADDNEENKEDSVSSGADFAQRDDTSESDSEVSSSQEDQYTVQPVDKQKPCEEDAMVSQGSDNTQDPEEDEYQFSQVKDWIISDIVKTMEFNDVLANFPDISVVLIKEIMDKLVLEGLLAKSGRDMYIVNRQKDPESEFDVKDEIDDEVPQDGVRTALGTGEDYLYMKALYHALPLDYVTVVQLQSKLDGDANKIIATKLINKMAQDGLVESASNRRLGKRVIHSDAAERKLHEVRKALNLEAMDIDALQSKSNQSEVVKSVNKKTDVSTCGVLHSIGSDITRIGVKSDFDQAIIKTEEDPITPISKIAPAASRESSIPGNGKNKSDGHTKNYEADDVMCSRSSQGKRSWKASMVKEPIIQYYTKAPEVSSCVES